MDNPIMQRQVPNLILSIERKRMEERKSSSRANHRTLRASDQRTPQKGGKL